MNIRILLAFLVVFTFNSLKAQYTIDGAGGASPVSTCTGTFLDNGNGGSYTDANFTFTICPDNPGDVIQVDFVAFSLATDPNPNNSDYLYVFDGDDVSAPSLGNYTGGVLAGVPITGTVNNTSGCLTFVFDSNTGNPNALPGWEALISCTTPCAAPTSVSAITSPETINDGLTTTVCMGETVSFSGAGSAVAPGFVLDHYEWNFDDGIIDNTSGVNASHSWDEPGEYLVALTIYDNNGCQSLNLNPLQVLVSTLPQVTLDYDEEVCFGETIDMTGTAEGVTWTSLPPQVVSGETYLADGAGFSYNSTIEFDFFEPGATLENCEDLISIVFNMEHSYLGDLEMNIECPDGTLVTLLDFGNNAGGGTFLGEPCDQNGNTTTPGVGYDYGWAPGLTNGNLDADANASSVTFTDNEGFNVTNDVVIPGLYQAEEDLCNLVGCPLNGQWTFSVIDNLFIDNGYIFEWGLNLNPALFPDVTTFTPTVGEEIDSTWWSGPVDATILNNGNTITFIPDSPGTFDFTYNTINSFGCGYDTTITVTVEEMHDIEAWPDAVIDCGDNIQVGVDILGGGSAADYDFSWTPPEYFASSTLQNPTAIAVNGNIDFEVTVNVEGHPACFKTDIMSVTVPGALILDPDTAVCGMEYQLNATAVGTGQWTVPAGLTLTGSGDPLFDGSATVTATTPGLYTLTWTDLDGQSCPNTLDLNISFFDGIEITADVQDAMCFGDCNGEVTVSGNGGMISGDYSYIFLNENPINITGNQVTDLCPGNHTVILIDDNGCSDSDVYFINEPPMVVIDTVMAFREECQDYCNGSIEIVSDQATAYSYDGGFTFEPNSIRNDFCTGLYEVYIEDDNGCIGGPITAFVGSPTPPEANFTAFPAPVDVLNPQVVFTNTSVGDVSSQWIFNVPDPVGTSDQTDPVFIFPTEPGLYPVELTVLDSIGCPDAIVRDILVNDVLQIYVPNSFTPNEDGLNDLFQPIGNDIDPEYYSFVVYSRWGDEVYRSDTYPHSWNGSLNNKKEYYMPDGYYGWALTTKSKTTTKKINLTGAILIAR